MSDEANGLEVEVCVTTSVVTDPEVRVRFPALPDFLTSSGSGTWSTQPCEDN
jgi:hypothetical protein